MAAPTYISLFAGAGGLDLAVRIALPGSRCLCYVEREGSAAGILAARMEDGSLEDAPIWSDVRTFPTELFRGRVDGIIGGFPCQDLSVAGKREGITGKRSGLWEDYRRIIAETKPQWVLVENVSGLVSSLTIRHRSDLMGHLDDIQDAADHAPTAKERWYLSRHRDRLYWRLLKQHGISALLYVCCCLEEMGYRVESTPMAASDVGAPHRRERIFILAVDNTDGVRQFRGNAPKPKSGGDGVCSTATGSSTGSGGELAHAPQRGQRVRGESPRRCGLPDGGGGAVGDSADDHGRRRECGAQAGVRQGGIGGRGSAITGQPLADPGNGLLPQQGWGSQTRDGAGSAGTELFPPGPSDSAAWSRVLAERPWLAPAIGAGTTAYVGHPEGGIGHGQAQQDEWEDLFEDRWASGTVAHTEHARSPQTGAARGPQTEADNAGGSGRGSRQVKEETKPGLRLLADELAVVLDASRAAQLRAAGNGVVALQGAAALRILLRRAGLV